MCGWGDVFPVPLIPVRDYPGPLPRYPGKGRRSVKDGACPAGSGALLGRATGGSRGRVEMQPASLPGQQEARPAPGRGRRATRPEFGAGGQVEEEQEQQRQEAAAADATLPSRRLALHGARRRDGFRGDARERRRSTRCPLLATASRLEVGLSRRSSSLSRGLVARLCRRTRVKYRSLPAPSPTGRGARPPRLCSARPGSRLLGGWLDRRCGARTGSLQPARLLPSGGRFPGAGKRRAKARWLRLPARGSPAARVAPAVGLALPSRNESRLVVVAPPGRRSSGTGHRAPPRLCSKPSAPRCGAAAGRASGASRVAPSGMLKGWPETTRSRAGMAELVRDLNRLGFRPSAEGSESFPVPVALAQLQGHSWEGELRRTTRTPRNYAEFPRPI